LNKLTKPAKVPHTFTLTLCTIMLYNSLTPALRSCDHARVCKIYREIASLQSGQVTGDWSQRIGCVWKLGFVIWSHNYNLNCYITPSWVQEGHTTIENLLLYCIRCSLLYVAVLKIDLPMFKNMFQHTCIACDTGLGTCNPVLELRVYGGIRSTPC